MEQAIIPSLEQEATAKQNAKSNTKQRFLQTLLTNLIKSASFINFFFCVSIYQ